MPSKKYNKKSNRTFSKSLKRDKRRRRTGINITFRRYKKMNGGTRLSEEFDKKKSEYFEQLKSGPFNTILTVDADRFYVENFIIDTVNATFSLPNDVKHRLVAVYAEQFKILDKYLVKSNESNMSEYKIPKANNSDDGAWFFEHLHFESFTINDNSFNEKKNLFLTNETLYRDAGAYLGIRLLNLKLTDKNNTFSFTIVRGKYSIYISHFSGFDWNPRSQYFFISKPNIYTDHIKAERATNFFNKLKFIF